MSLSVADTMSLAGTKRALRGGLSQVGRPGTPVAGKVGVPGCQDKGRPTGKAPGVSGCSEPPLFPQRGTSIWCPSDIPVNTAIATIIITADSNNKYNYRSRTESDDKI